MPADRTSALFNLALLIRLTRSGGARALLAGLRQVRGGRKGLTNARVIGRPRAAQHPDPDRHRDSACSFGSLIGLLAIVTESVFAWPGMGKLLIDSIGVLDRPVIVAYLLSSS